MRCVKKRFYKLFKVATFSCIVSTLVLGGFDDVGNGEIRGKRDVYAKSESLKNAYSVGTGMSIIPDIVETFKVMGDVESVEMENEEIEKVEQVKINKEFTSVSYKEIDEVTEEEIEVVEVPELLAFSAFYYKHDGYTEYLVYEDTLKDKKAIDMKATAYTLSVASCGKSRNHPQYGIGASGLRVKKGVSVATDPKVIPLGTVMYIEFPDGYEHMSGIYQSQDTGSAVKGYVVDIFFGEDAVGESILEEACREFGRRGVKVYILS